MFQSHIPTKFWNFVVAYVAHLINCQVSPILGDKSSYEILFNALLDISHLRVFRCLAFASTLTSHRK